MPRPYYFAKMSQLAYIPDNQVHQERIGSWKYELDSGPTKIGYRGIAYKYEYSVKKNGKKGEIIIAHRGTEKSLLQNLRSDACLAVGGIPDSYKEAKSFSNRIREAFGKEYDYYETGHSLGGYYAQLNAVEFEGKAVVFDAPGVIDALGSKFKSSIHDNITNYVSAPHFINTVGGKTGRTIRIYVSHVDEQILTQESAKNFIDYIILFIGEKFNKIVSNLLFDELNYVARLHSIEKIVSTFNPHIGFPYLQSEMPQWPTLLDYINSKFWTYFNPLGKWQHLYPKVVIPYIVEAIKLGLTGNDDNSRNCRIEDNLNVIKNYKNPELFMLPENHFIGDIEKSRLELYVDYAKRKYDEFYTDTVHARRTNFYSSLDKILVTEEIENLNQDNSVFNTNTTSISTTATTSSMTTTTRTIQSSENLPNSSAFSAITETPDLKEVTPKIYEDVFYQPSSNSKIEALLSRASISLDSRQSREIVQVSFKDPEDVKAFQAELLRVGIGHSSPSEHGRPRKADYDKFSDAYIIPLTSDEYNAVKNDENAYAKLVSTIQSSSSLVSAVTTTPPAHY